MHKFQSSSGSNKILLHKCDNAENINTVTDNNYNSDDNKGSSNLVTDNTSKKQ